MIDTNRAIPDTDIGCNLLYLAEKQIRLIQFFNEMVNNFQNEIAALNFNCTSVRRNEAAPFVTARLIKKISLQILYCPGKHQYNKAFCSRNNRR
jgi:hypothetical protein